MNKKKFQLYQTEMALVSRSVFSHFIDKKTRGSLVGGEETGIEVNAPMIHWPVVTAHGFYFFHNIHFLNHR